MTKKKNKFDLGKLIQRNYLQDGEELYFVSDPSKTCRVTKMPNNEYKITTKTGTVTTIHAYATECLATEPPDHASRWFRTGKGKTLYELWNMEDDYAQAA